MISIIRQILRVILHKYFVAVNLCRFARILSSRAISHDSSKLSKFEIVGFANADELSNKIYGTKEYYDMINNLYVVDEHYRRNSHHPQHYDDGIYGFDLIDLIEMYCDWCAATKNTKDGYIFDSIAINQKRFWLSKDLIAILRNTAKRYKIN